MDINTIEYRQNKIVEILKSEIVPALGCTEPIAVALAAAKAKEYLDGDINNISIEVSPNIYKNGMGVGVPGTGMVGLTIAAALGAICGKSSDKLEVLKYVTDEYVTVAKSMISQNKVVVKPINTKQKLLIIANCSDGINTAQAIIEERHSNITQVSLNGEIVETFKEIKKENLNSKEKEDDFILNFDDIYNFSMNVPIEKIEFIIEGSEMNSTLSEIGLREKSGLGVGANLAAKLDNLDDKNELMSAAMARTAAASDARMSGAMQAAMSTAGSGNQGITAMMPIVSVARSLKSPKEKLIRALILSNLTVIYMKKYFGRLSAACGCVVASTGAACGITYLLGGTEKQISYSIKNMIGNLTGMICDGAKLGCALKVATGTSAAVQSAYLALSDICIAQTDGIVEFDVDNSIRNIGKITCDAMDKVDDKIIEIMINKNNK